MTKDDFLELRAHHLARARMAGTTAEMKWHWQCAIDLQSHREELREVVEAVRGLLTIVTNEYSEHLDTSDVEHWQPAITAGEVVLAKHTKSAGASESEKSNGSSC